MSDITMNHQDWSQFINDDKYWDSPFLDLAMLDPMEQAAPQAQAGQSDMQANCSLPPSFRPFGAPEERSFLDPRLLDMSVYPVLPPVYPPQADGDVLVGHPQAPVQPSGFNIPHDTFMGYHDDRLDAIRAFNDSHDMSGNVIPGSQNQVPSQQAFAEGYGSGPANFQDQGYVQHQQQQQAQQQPAQPASHVPTIGGPQPTWRGYVENLHDVMLIIEAVVAGQLALTIGRVTRATAPACIKHGNVFVFSKKLEKQKAHNTDPNRWTDHLAWSPSRKFRSKTFGQEQWHEGMSFYRETDWMQDTKARKREEHLACPAGIMDYVGPHIGQFGYRELGLVKKVVEYQASNGQKYTLVAYHRPEQVHNLSRPALGPLSLAAPVEMSLMRYVQNGTTFHRRTAPNDKDLTASQVPEDAKGDSKKMAECFREQTRQGKTSRADRKGLAPLLKIANYEKICNNQCGSRLDKNWCCRNGCNVAQ